jgi:exoribonuclease R
MNHQCAKTLMNKPNSIFRSTTKKETSLLCDNNPQLNYILNNISGKYCSINNFTPHYMISNRLDCYTHITSPIRRIVDCVNMLILQKDNFEWSDNALKFLNKWTSQEMIDIINTKIKDIRTLENEINIMNVYEENKSNNIYFGTIFDKTLIEKKSNEEIQMFKYKIYIEKLKLISTIKSSKEYIDYSTVDVSIHQFLDEVKMYKKIRLQLI